MRCTAYGTPSPCLLPLTAGLLITVSPSPDLLWTAVVAVPGTWDGMLVGQEAQLHILRKRELMQEPG